MNSSLIGRIAWKEYRQQRALLLSVVALSVFSQLAVVLVCLGTGANVDIDGLFVIGLGMPTLYALGCGALLFAGEDEAGTLGFLHTIPVSSRELLIGKVGFAVVSTMVLMPVLWLCSMAITQGVMPEPTNHVRIWLICIVGWIEVLAWSVLCSLLVRRVLWATLIAGCTAAMAALAWYLAVGGQFLDADRANILTLPGHFVTVLMLVLATAFFSRRWLGELPIRRPIPWRTTLLQLREYRADQPTRPWLIPTFKRLLWQERRQSVVVRRALMASAVVLGILYGICAWNGESERLPGWLVLPAFAAIMGTCVFAGDQRQMSFRYFCERGVSPRLIWLTRQLTWCVWPTVAIVILTSVATLQYHTDAESSMMTVGQIMLFYAIGQASSLFMRSSLLALVATAAGCIVASIWHLLVLEFNISAVAAVWPIALILLFGTWLRMPDWITENTTWRARLRAIGSLAIPVVVLLACIATYRATEIPKIPLPYDRANIERPPTAAERLAADQYNAAWRQFRAAAAAEASTREDLRADALRQFLAATRQRGCRFSNHNGVSAKGEPDIEALTRCVAEMAETREHQGQLDEALEIYWALLRLAEHLYAQPGALRHLQGRDVEKSVLEKLPRWAARPGQTLQRVLDALDQLETQLNRIQPNWELAISGDYCLYRRLTERDPETVERYRRADTKMLSYVAWFGRSEQVRMLRLLDQLADRNLERARRQWNILNSGGSIEVQLSVQQDARIHRWQRSTPLRKAFGDIDRVFSYQDLGEFETRRRAARVQMALVAWQIEHRELPESLAELANHGLKSVPLDPFSGQPIRYLPRGGSVLNNATKVYEPGPPCLWMAGPELSYATTDPSEPTNYRNFYYRFGQLRSENELWQHGSQFPIPIVAADEMP